MTVDDVRTLLLVRNQNISDLLLKIGRDRIDGLEPRLRDVRNRDRYRIVDSRTDVVGHFGDAVSRNALACRLVPPKHFFVTARTNARLTPPSVLVEPHLAVFDQIGFA